MEVADEYAAWCLDQATYWFGATLEAELSEVEGKTKGEVERKQRRIFARVMSDGKGKQYADPAERLKGGD